MVLAFPNPPADWVGTKPEWAVAWALTQLGVEFDYQSPQAGGRQTKGGAVIDFMIDSHNLGISVHGEYWHYGSSVTQLHDMMVRSMMESWGITIIYIDESEALRDPIYFVKEALAGRDHSKMMR